MSSIEIKKVEEYDFNEIYETLSNMINRFGIDFHKEMKVALKPNLVLKKKAEACATTNPLIVKALGRIIREKGAKVFLIESPGGPFTKARLEAIYRETGMEKVCREEGIQLNYDTKSRSVTNDEGKILKKIEIIDKFKDMDFIINLPKLKTHGQMVYTGAIKNMFGAVPGVTKAEHHFRTPDYSRFADSIIDIFLSIKPNLNIMDAIDAMEGNGPTAGDKRKMSFIMASDNAFLMDCICSKIINLEPSEVPILKQSEKRHLVNFKEINKYNNIIEAFFCPDFKIPSRDNPKLLDFSDRTVSAYFMKWLKPKPVVHHRKCVMCGDCIRSCPAGAMEAKKGKVKISLDKCIRCYCCQELCTREAIDIKQGQILKIYFKLRDILLK